MAVFCDACETKLSEGKSKCCKADVWTELRQDGSRNICMDCDDDCEVV